MAWTVPRSHTHSIDPGQSRSPGAARASGATRKKLGFSCRFLISEQSRSRNAPPARGSPAAPLRWRSHSRCADTQALLSTATRRSDSEQRPPRHGARPRTGSRCWGVGGGGREGGRESESGERERAVGSFRSDSVLPNTHRLIRKEHSSPPAFFRLLVLCLRGIRVRVGSAAFVCHGSASWASGSLVGSPRLSGALGAAPDSAWTSRPGSRPKVKASS